MNILHCIYDHIRNPWVGGGGAVRAHEIYRRLSRRHKVTVLCGRYPGATNYGESDIRYEFVGTGRNNYILSTLCYAVKAAGYLRNNADKYDVVVEDFAPYNPVFSFVWQKDAVLQLHQREGLRHLKKYAFLGIPFFLIEKFYHRFFRSAVTISGFSRERYGLKGKARVIPNGFDPALLSGGAEEGDYILFLGRLHINQKGLDTLRDALRLVTKNIKSKAPSPLPSPSGGEGSNTAPPLRGGDKGEGETRGFINDHPGKCRLVIVGGGKDEERVRSLFDDSVATGRTEFVGYAWGERKEELMRKCLFLVAPSRYEGQPLTVIEAAACGKPVIVSDIPELRYAVDAGFALSFRTGYARDLAEKMGLLLHDRSLRQEMGIRAREYAKNFTWDRIAEEYEKYLLGLVSVPARKE